MSTSTDHSWNLSKAKVFKSQFGWNVIRPQIPGAGWKASMYDTWEEAYAVAYEEMDSPEAHLVLALSTGSLRLRD